MPWPPTCSSLPTSPTHRAPLLPRLSTDIRDISALTSAQLSPYSAPAIRAMAWELILKANSIAYTRHCHQLGHHQSGWPWSRFFAGTGLFDHDFDLRDGAPEHLQAARSPPGDQGDDGAGGPGGHLHGCHPRPPFSPPFGITWPRPTTGAYAAFATSWGADPNSTTTPIPPVTLSMAKAVQVRGVYPNDSEGEVAYAGFTMSADRAYTLIVTASPALAGTAQLELMLPLLPVGPADLHGERRKPARGPLRATAPPPCSSRCGCAWSARPRCSRTPR